jgi:hypothetical protein
MMPTHTPKDRDETHSMEGMYLGMERVIQGKGEMGE